MKPEPGQSATCARCGSLVRLTKVGTVGWSQDHAPGETIWQWASRSAPGVPETRCAVDGIRRVHEVTGYEWRYYGAPGERE